MGDRNDEKYKKREGFCRLETPDVAEPTTSGAASDDKYVNPTMWTRRSDYLWNETDKPTISLGAIFSVKPS